MELLVHVPGGRHVFLAPRSRHCRSLHRRRSWLRLLQRCMMTKYLFVCYAIFTVALALMGESTAVCRVVDVFVLGVASASRAQWSTVGYEYLTSKGCRESKQPKYIESEQIKLGLQMVPDELMLTLADQWPCRDPQIRQLASLLSVSCARSKVHQWLIGKAYITKSFDSDSPRS